jgi:hypothetical protein
MTDEIRNKLWNIELIIEDIKLFPQTYNTILQDLYKDGTCQLILRRKLNNLCKEGKICKTTIPGTRFGKIIFYHIPKKYFILIEGDRIGSNVYIFFNYEKLSKFYIKLNEHWILSHGLWIKKDNKIIFGGSILKWI